jgi:hypothetical protein
MSIPWSPMKFALLCTLFIATLALTGCGPRQGDVSGTAKYKGQPLAGGTITFYDEQGKPVSSAIKDDGAYAIKNVTAGTAKIAIVMPFVMPDLPLAKSVAIPAKYNNPAESGLIYVVITGSQTKDFDLTD